MSRLDVSPLPEFDLTGGRIIITSPYGMRWGRLHGGVDLGSTDGIEKVTAHAPALGSIIRVANDGPGPSAGLNLWFESVDGRKWKFFHLDAVLVDPKVTVAAGTPIARIGMSGTEAVHLHLEDHTGSANWNQPIDLTADVRECLAAGRFPGKAPAVVIPPVVTPPAPTISPEDNMIVCLLTWPDKPDVEVLGLDSDGWWAKHLDNPIEAELLQAKGIAARKLAVGNDPLDALYESARKV